MRPTGKRYVALGLTVAFYGATLGTARAEEKEPGGHAPVDDLNLMELLNVEVSTATKTAESWTRPRRSSPS